MFITLPENYFPWSLSEDGEFSVGGLLVNSFAWKWSNATKTTISLGGESAVSISSDATAIIGNSKDNNRIENAAVWQNDEKWTLLGSFNDSCTKCDFDFSSSFGSSEDGQMIVGLGWCGCRIAHGFSYTKEGGMVDLGTIVNGRSTRANGVSGDGSTIVGWQDLPDGQRVGVYWKDGIETYILTKDGEHVGEAQKASRDGSIIIGDNCIFDQIVQNDMHPRETSMTSTSPLGTGAWVWTEKDGTVCLPGSGVLGTSMSADGRVIGGSTGNVRGGDAIIWIDRKHYVLQDYLKNHGIDIGTLQLTLVSSISSDGKVVAGSAFVNSSSFIPVGFIATLP